MLIFLHHNDLKHDPSASPRLEVSSRTDTVMTPWRRWALFATTVLVAGACVSLGVWQLVRLRERRSANARAMAERELPPVRIGEGRLSRNPSHRRVEAAGEYDLAREFVIRARLLREIPGVQIVTPLRIQGLDTAVLVNRGFVPAPDGVRPRGIDYGEPGRVEVRGSAQPVPDRGDGAPLVSHGAETWNRLDLTAMGVRLPYPVAAYYLILQADSGSPDHTFRGRRYPIRLDPPPLDNGPHLSYAIQWFFFAGLALAFGVVFVLGKGKRK